MKQKIWIAIVVFLIGGVVGYFLNPVINRDRDNFDGKGYVTKAKVSPDKDTEQNDEADDKKFKKTLSRIDYPLIDIYFEKDKEYRLELTDFEGKKLKQFKESGDFFQANKEFFSIFTIPSGRGTTPPYILNVYEGKKGIMSIECSEVRQGVLDGKW